MTYESVFLFLSFFNYFLTKINIITHVSKYHARFELFDNI